MEPSKVEGKWKGYNSSKEMRIEFLPFFFKKKKKKITHRDECRDEDDRVERAHQVNPVDEPENVGDHTE